MLCSYRFDCQNKCFGHYWLLITYHMSHCWHLSHRRIQSKSIWRTWWKIGTKLERGRGKTHLSDFEQSPSVYNLYRLLYRKISVEGRKGRKARVLRICLIIHTKGKLFYQYISTRWDPFAPGWQVILRDGVLCWRRRRQGSCRIGRGFHIS